MRAPVLDRAHQRRLISSRRPDPTTRRNSSDFIYVELKARGDVSLAAGRGRAAFPDQYRPAVLPDQSGGHGMEYERLRPWGVPDYYERQAARLRELAETATTARLKKRLLQEADEHERLARGDPPLGAEDEC